MVLSYLLAIVCYFWTTGHEFTNEHFFIPIEYTHHSNDCLNRGMECYFAMNNCLLMPLIEPLYANCVIECLFLTYDCQKMLLIVNCARLNVHLASLIVERCSCLFIDTIECL